MSDKKSVQIVSCEKEVKLLKDPLLNICEKIDKNLPIAILNVSGEFRTGKSTLLNLFVSILEKYEKCENLDRIHIEDLKLCGGCLNGGKRSSSGFGWKAGNESCTKGIWMLDHVFVIPNPSKKTKKMVVLLVDAEGLESNDSKNGIDQVIFGISNLMSSVVILNQKQQLGKNDITNLRLLVDFCPPEKEKANGCFCGIELLMRDFKYEEEEIEEQKREMKEFKDSLFNSNEISIKNNLKVIKSCYRYVDIFGLPQPGEEIEYENFDGDMSKFSDEFKELLLYYIKKILSEKLHPTYENKESLYCLCEALNKRIIEKGIPQLSQMHRIYYENNNQMIDIIKPLKEKFEKSSLTPEELKKECERAKKGIEDYKPKFLGTSDMIKETMNYIYEEVNILIKECEQRDYHAKFLKLLEEEKKKTGEERKRLEEERKEFERKMAERDKELEIMRNAIAKIKPTVIHITVKKGCHIF